MSTRRQITTNRQAFASLLRNWFHARSCMPNFVETPQKPRRFGRNFSSAFEHLEARAMMAVLSNLTVDPKGMSDGQTSAQVSACFFVPPASTVANTESQPTSEKNDSTTTISLNSFSTIVTRGLAYAGATGASASTSLATDKSALLPGQTSTFANYSNYSRGLNGIVVDVSGLPASTTSSQVAESLQFASWDGIAAAGFVNLPGPAVPTVTLLPGGGVDGSTRVRITFPNNTVQNTWLRVTVLANTNTGLAANDVFYFGNVIGELNVDNTATRLRVTQQDVASMLINQSPAPNSANANNRFDLDRNGRVNGQDYAILFANLQAGGIVAPITAPSSRPLPQTNWSSTAQTRGIIAAPSPSLLSMSKTPQTEGKIVENALPSASTIKGVSNETKPVSNVAPTSETSAPIRNDEVTNKAKKKDQIDLKNVDSLFASRLEGF